MLPVIVSVHHLIHCDGNLKIQEAGTSNVSLCILIGAFCRNDQQSHWDLRGKMQDSEMQGSYIGELRLFVRASSDWFCSHSLREESQHRNRIYIFFLWR